ncbi:hypothetical protein IMSHALPRED_000703 [Imshaugia aleurites]|uniref:Uncharacterized protein n=1 Tax=Imshaugia aleurites TaxID=172621 RepID=A0A8H3G7B8_9LECA|nr:hypothetical protein IMSHALPRED_000703 [Imshaugia aleurites]
MALREAIIRQNIHTRMLITQPGTPTLRLRQPPQHRSLPAPRIQPSPLPIKHQHILPRQFPGPPPAILRARLLIAQPILQMQRVPLALHDLDIPTPTQGAGPINATTDRDAIPDAGREAGELGVLVREAEVVEEEGRVAVRVVVFELEVVRFAVALRGRGGVGAEAEGAAEVVAEV